MHLWTYNKENTSYNLLCLTFDNSYNADLFMRIWELT
jgi:hypothetical protein